MVVVVVVGGVVCIADDARSKKLLMTNISVCIA